MNDMAQYRFDCINAYDQIFSGLYQKGETSRDESTLLLFYNRDAWKHDTIKGTTFKHKRTNVIVSGLTQTKHVAQLLKSEDKIDSGFIPRLTTVLLWPQFTPYA